MLILTRRVGESIYIGDHVKVTVFESKGGQVRIGIDAPSQLRIYREEIYKQIQEENMAAAEAARATPDATALEQMTGVFGQGLRPILSPASRSDDDESNKKRKADVHGDSAPKTPDKGPEVIKKRSHKKEGGES